MIQLIIFAIASTIVARYLEKAKFVVAMIAHAVLFTVAFSIALLASDIPLIQGVFINLMGEQSYALVHSVFVESAFHASTIFSAFFAIEIFTILSVVLAAMVATIRAYKKLVAKKLKVSKPLLPGFPIPSSVSSDSTPHLASTWNYLALGQLRN